MRVVVGTDGSPGGLAAVRWALELCEARHDPSDVVELVHVHARHELAMPLFAPTSVTPPGRYLADRPGTTVAFEADTIARRADLQEHYRHEAEQLLVSQLHDAGGARGVRVELVTLAGDDHGQTLVEHADGADLLAVGVRGHGRLAPHLLGSVSEHCVHHAHCPVVVVRDR